MKVVAAYLLAVLGGNASPSAADLKNILGSGQRYTELIAAGREKLASVPAGGGALAMAAPAVGGGAASAAAAESAAAESKKEEKVEEKEELIFTKSTNMHYKKYGK